MDGATGTQFMNIVHDLTTETRDVGNAPPWVVERPSRARMLGRAYSRRLAQTGPGRGYAEAGWPGFHANSPGQEG